MIEGKEVTLRAEYIKQNNDGSHVVRLKMHRSIPDNDGQLMTVDASVILEAANDS